MPHSALTNQISASPWTTGGDTLRRPGQWVLTLRIAPTTGGYRLALTQTALEHFVLVWLLYRVWFKKIFGVALNNGWRTLCAAPDNGW